MENELHHSKRRRKCARSVHYRPKNYERHRLKALKENIPPSNVPSLPDVPCTASLPVTIPLASLPPSAFHENPSLPDTPCTTVTISLASLPPSAFHESPSLPDTPCTASLPVTIPLPPSVCRPVCDTTSSDSEVVAMHAGGAAAHVHTSGVPAAEDAVRHETGSGELAPRLSCDGRVATASLPNEQWQVFEDGDEMQYCKVERTESGVHRVTSSVIVHCDKSWDVFYCDRKVPTFNTLLASFPDHIGSSEVATQLLTKVDRAVLCPGNPEEKFVDLCSKRGGEVKGERGHGAVIACIDNTSVTDSHGKIYGSSVRRTDCEVICSLPARCKACSVFRSSLRKTLSRHRKGSSEERTSASSHACYKHLTSAEKDTRLRNLHHSLKVTSHQASALRAKVDKLIQDQSLTLQGSYL